jgi:hypothetical protein
VYTLCQHPVRGSSMATQSTVCGEYGSLIDNCALSGCGIALAYSSIAYQYSVVRRRSNMPTDVSIARSPAWGSTWEMYASRSQVNSRGK